MYQYVHPRLRAFWSSTFEHESPEDAQLRLAAALTIISLHVTYGLPLGKDDINGLCRALCLRPGVDKTMSDWEGLDVHFMQSKRLVICLGMTKFFCKYYGGSEIYK